MNSWQYNGVAPMAEVIKWCLTTFGDPPVTWHSNGFETIYFRDEKDYAWFMLKWA